MACCRYFNPRFPQGKRPAQRDTSQKLPQFQSTLPAREATSSDSVQPLLSRNFNPRFPQGKRPHDGPLPPRDVVISIHASRKGSDNPDIALNPDNVISIHASRKGSDVLRRQHHSRNRRFQSTLPAREATKILLILIYKIFYFNPRFPQGKRHNPSTPLLLLH